MKKAWKIAQYALFILTFAITIFVIFFNRNLGLIIRGVLLTSFFGTIILEDKLGNQSEFSRNAFQVFRAIAIIAVFLVDFKF
ncbi:hypothetical protein [Romboutsia sp.]|uniref:hypothetical protein n=1 Tax=Romboutsia sp. TaxID=1965302 RepID=UPI003F349DCD